MGRDEAGRSGLLTGWGLAVRVAEDATRLARGAGMALRNGGGMDEMTVDALTAPDSGLVRRVTQHNPSYA